MYKILTMQEEVRVPPTEFGKPIKEAILQLLRSNYEGQVDKESGVVVAVMDVLDVKEGYIKPGDGAAFHPTKYTALIYKPELHEVVEGIVIEIVEFGAFVNLGAIDGLIHISQVTDDFLNYDGENQRLQGKESKKHLKVDDKVRAKIVAISLKKSQSQKVGLTMRQPGLGNVEWIEEAVKKEAEKKEGKKKEIEKKETEKKETKKPASKKKGKKAKSD